MLGRHLGEELQIEMLFAHLKRILKLDRLRLRSPNDARDEFTLAATAQNLRKDGQADPDFRADVRVRPAKPTRPPNSGRSTTKLLPTFSTESARRRHAAARPKCPLPREDQTQPARECQGVGAV
jgi:hypothetical protein